MKLFKSRILSSLVIMLFILAFITTSFVFADNNSNNSKLFFHNENLELTFYSNVKWNTIDELINIILTGPSKSEFKSVIPKNTKLINTLVDENNILYVNLSEDFINNTDASTFRPDLIYDVFVKNLSEGTDLKGIKFLVNGNELDIINDYAFNEIFYFYPNTINDVTVTPNYIPNDLYLVIDPGHGGVRYLGYPLDVGAYNWEVQNSILEKDAVLDIGLKLKNYATMAEEVTMTRTGDDLTLSNAERVNRVNNSGANLLISIHHNAEPDGDGQGHTAKGIRTLYYDSTDNLHASDIHSKAKDAYFGSTLGYFENDGIGYQNLYILKDTTVPGALIEAGFISNTSHDYQVINNSSYRSEIAYHIWLGIRYDWWGY